jgi:hypothetical protein
VFRRHKKKYVFDANGELLGWFKYHRQLSGRLVIRAEYNMELMPGQLRDVLVSELKKTGDI